MNVHLKLLESFANWPLAIEFLRRAGHHFLLAHERPPDDIDAALRDRILLQGVRDPGPYVCLPAAMEGYLIRAICSSIMEGDKPAGASFTGALRGSNFFAFLHSFAQKLKGKFDLNEVAQAIVEETTLLFDAEGASILVPDDDGKTFRFAYLQAASSEVSDRLSQVAVSATQGVIGWVAQNRTAIWVADAVNSPFFDRGVDRVSSFKTRNLLAAPILIGEELIGIVEVVNKKTAPSPESDRQILELIAAIIAIFIEKAQLYTDKLALVQVQKELEIAHSLQTHLMPDLPVDLGPFHLVGESKQLSHVGGDFWDVLDLGDAQKLLLLGDVSGHGLSAALVMTTVRTASRALLGQTESPRAMLKQLSSLIYHEFSKKFLYVTLLICHLNLEDGSLSLARAGHEHPLIIDKEGIHILKKEGGYPLGLLPGEYRSLWHPLSLKNGTQLCLFTDGVVDGLDGTHHELVRLLNQWPDLEDCLERGDFFARLSRDHGWRDMDDATFLKLSLTPA